MSRIGRKMARKNVRGTQKLVSQANHFEERRQCRIRDINAREYAERLHESQEIARGTLAVLIVSCNKTCGLGKERLDRVLAKIDLYQNSMLAGMVTVEDLETILHDEANIRVEKNNNHYWQSIRKMSAMVMLALHDLYGFGEKRLARVYNYAAKLSQQINRHEVTGDEVADELKKIGLIY